MQKTFNALLPLSHLHLQKKKKEMFFFLETITLSGMEIISLNCHFFLHIFLNEEDGLFLCFNSSLMQNDDGNDAAMMEMEIWL